LSFKTGSGAHFKLELGGQYLWNLHVLQFESKLKSIEEQMDMNGNKLSNHKKYIEKVVEKVQKISDCGAVGISRIK